MRVESTHDVSDLRHFGVCACSRCTKFGMRTHRRNQAVEPNRALGTRRNATGVLRDKGVHLLCSGVTTAKRGTEKCCATAEHNNMLWAFVCPQHCLDPKKGEFCVNFPRFRKGFPCVLVQWSKIQRSTCA